MTSFIHGFALLILFASLVTEAKTPLKVVTTTTDLEYLVKTVGGDLIEVSSIVKGTQDPHDIEAKPSFILKLREADLVVRHGLGLEDSWVDPLIQGARNRKLSAKENGVLILGPQLDPIDQKVGTVSRAQGDVHPEGNPHFNLDPTRMGRAALMIAGRLSQMLPQATETFTQNAKAFQKKVEDKMVVWQQRVGSSGVKEVVTYHKTFSYFLNRFNIENHIQIEPKPGIPPTAQHLEQVIATIKTKKIKIVLIENYFAGPVVKKLSQELPDVKIRVVPVAVRGGTGIESYFDLIEQLVGALDPLK